MALDSTAALARLRTRLSGLQSERTRMLDSHALALTLVDTQIAAVQSAIAALADPAKRPVADALLNALDQAGLKLVVADK